jgi:hypothetical protein
MDLLMDLPNLSTLLSVHTGAELYMIATWRNADNQSVYYE